MFAPLGVTVVKGNLWDTNAPSEDQPLDLLVYRSRLIGSDTDLVVWGGGNTSVKTVEIDHAGRTRAVLRIKGSGTDLKSIDRSGFPGVFLDEVLPLFERAGMDDQEMAAYLEHCMTDVHSARPSIETLLHAFVPARHVDHVHADAIVAVTNTAHGRAAVREALGPRVAFVPYRRPGFTLAKEVTQAARDHDAVVLEKHGLVTWGDTARESYDMMISLVEAAESYLASRTRDMRVAPVPAARSTTDLPPLLLRLRGRLGRVILRLETGEPFRSLADRPDIRALATSGPATADHVLRIRPWACVLEGNDPVGEVDAYEERYRTFFQVHASPELTMLDYRPKVFVVPGVGLIAAGRDARDARVTAEVALHTLLVAARATDAHGSYESLDEESLFHVDYWPLELYKLTLGPPPQELAGRVAIVTGAASGIGRAVARHLAGLGAHLALFDTNQDGLRTTASQITERGGVDPLQVGVDLTVPEAVRDAVRRVVETYGGIDALVSNAGIGAPGALVELSQEQWQRSLDVNCTSHFLVTAEVMRTLTAQGLGGSLVFIASKNAFGPGAGFGAYSAAKAAQVQLARIAALEGGAHGIRSNVVNPDAVFEDSGLWSPDVRAQRAASHGVAVDDLEAFYAQRNLLKTTITGQDVAEAVSFLISDRSRATTGTVIAVDGGVAAAFPR
ncbi:MAG: bifunctional aldolase/short-chain dehydrogenase [Chloroflexota bacterium]